MLLSHPRTINFQGKPATLRVLRNNGFCWGRLSLEDGTVHDVESDEDWYDDEDEDALDAFESVLREAEDAQTEPV
jgi:hypothetical protein